MSSTGSSTSNAYIDKTGFDDLVKYTKQNGDFFKELTAVMQERADLEIGYQKALSKLAIRANKVNTSTGGSFLNSWKAMAKQIEAEAQSHKTIAVAIGNEIIKPMKKLMEQHTKGRKSADGPVDKASKAINDRKNDAFKAQKNLLSKTKDFETTKAGSLSTTNNKGKELSQKEKSKMSSKHGKNTEAVTKADREYLKSVKVAETARCQHISTINQSAFSIQRVESEHMEEYRKVILKFVDVLGRIVPLIRNNYEAIKNGFSSVSPAADVQNSTTKGNQSLPAQQLLYDCFEDDMNIKLTQNNRRFHLQRKLDMLDAATDAEMKEQKAGQKPTDKSAAPNSAYLQMIHGKDMVNLLNASRYKIICALATVNSKPKPANPVSNYIRSEKDKSGIVKSFLVIPRDQNGQATQTVSKTSANSVIVDYKDEPVNSQGVPPAAKVAVAAAVVSPSPVPTQSQAGTQQQAGGGQQQPWVQQPGVQQPGVQQPGVQQQGTGAPVSAAVVAPPAAALATTDANAVKNTPFDDDNDSWDDEADGGDSYVALYDFVPTEEDQLALKEGDTVFITLKGKDGWCLGTVNGKSGQFPETYVKKLEMM